MHERQIAFTIRKQIFDHICQANQKRKLDVLKTLGISVNQKSLSITPIKTLAKKREEARYENRSELSHLDYTDPIMSNRDQSHDGKHRNHNFAFKGSSGYKRNRVVRAKKPAVPKTVSLSKLFMR